MKFPRNARIFRGRLDVAPFAAVFFLLAIFLLLASLVYTPGVRLDLPVANDLPGTDGPTVAVAIDARGRLYFQNQWVREDAQLEAQLRRAVAASTLPLSLMVQADKAVSYDRLIHLALLAREAGITRAWLATLPNPTSDSGGTSFP
jgi:biopolymer transport protein ExbD